jgi:hypothetical protein
LWSLFFTPEMQAKICTYTNTKIEEDIAKKGYTQEDLASKSHIKPTDEVNIIISCFFYGNCLPIAN